MANLEAELAAYREEEPLLEQEGNGKWVVFRKAVRFGLFDTFEEAAREAVRAYGRGPYLIRQIGVPPAALPVCVVQR